MIGILIAVLVAALVWAICVALGLPAIVGIVAAILVLLAGIPSGGYGLGSRFGSAAVLGKTQLGGSGRECRTAGSAAARRGL